MVFRVFPRFPEVGMDNEQKRPRTEHDEGQMGDEDMSSGYEGHMSKRQKTDEGMHGISGRVFEPFCSYLLNIHI